MNQPHVTYLVFFVLAILYSCKPDYSPADMTKLDSTYVQTLHYDSIPYNNNRAHVDKSIAYVDSVYRALENPSLAEQIFKFDRLVTYRFKERMFSNAMVYCDSMIELIEKEDAVSVFPGEYALAHFWQGDCYSHMGDYMKAYQCYFKGRKLTAKYIDTCSQGEYTYRIGMSLYREGQYKESARFFKECLFPNERCTMHIKYYNRRQELLNNIGLCYAKLKQYDSALYYYELALVKINENKALLPEVFIDDVPTGVVTGNMGKVYLAMGDTAKAIACFEKNIALNLQPYHDSHDAFFSVLEMISIYNARREFEKSYPLIEMVKRSLDTLYYNDTKSMLLMAEADYFTRIGKHQQASKLLSEYIFLRDSVERSIRLSKEMDVQHYITTLMQEDENRELKEENKRKQLIVVYALAIGLFFLLLLLGGLFLYRKTKQYVRVLTQLNATIEKQKSELEQRNKDKDQIMRIVAHDLRNPIWGINALSKMVLDDMASDDKQRESVQLINNSSDSTITLINELLEATMGLDEHMEKKSSDVHQVISHVVDMLKLRAAEKNLDIRWSSEQQSPLVFSFNQEKISRVLNNLLFNAIKFSHSGGVIEVTTARKQTTVLIGIKDNGVGVPSELHEKIFETFTPAKRTGTAGEKSFGLGLSICRSIAKAHGGNLWVESSEGQGSVFYLELPIN